MIHRQRLTARLDGKFVVFLIGLRINEPLRIRQWWPVVNAMPRMLQELRRQPDLGFIHAENWFARTLIMVQYWRSMEHLLAYAKAKDAAHLPAWRDFNRLVAATGSVGIWHEAYEVVPGGYENIYVNMPAFGLGKVGELVEAGPGLQSAAARLRASLN